jgi:predicted glycosyltransferase
MGGYNSCVEAVWLGRRAIIVPRVRPEDREQEIRAILFSELFPQISMVPVSPAGSLMERVSDALKNALGTAAGIPGRGSATDNDFFAGPAAVRKAIYG